MLRHFSAPTAVDVGNMVDVWCQPEPGANGITLPPNSVVGVTSIRVQNAGFLGQNLLVYSGDFSCPIASLAPGVPWLYPAAGQRHL